ncbi:unnamed protein product [Owenia fusiformis]|uniref:Uncharacterized protein n=1 Tax=Owenia fusiformis TaxID=6347 RepID=A0A8J1XLE9_OWEFU|nr:unnamed protein product [Owenia fusiformis]
MGVNSAAKTTTATMDWFHNLNISEIDGIEVMQTFFTDHRHSNNSNRFSPLSYTIVGVCLVCICVVGIIMNSLVLLTFLRKPKQRTPRNYFIIAITACDLLLGAIGTPLSAASYLAHRWLFGRIGCEYEAFIQFFVGLSGIYLLAMLSLDRYLIIVRQVCRVSYTRYVVMITVCLLSALIWATLPLIGWSSYQLEAANTSCSVNWASKHPKDVSYVIAIFICCLAFPVMVMLFSYSSVYLLTRRISCNSKKKFGSESRITRRNIRQEGQLTRTILMMIGAYLLSWTPYSVVSLWAATGNPRDIPTTAAVIPAILAKSAIVWNPVVYVGMNKKIRDGLIDMLPCKSIHGETNGTNDSSRTTEELKMRPLRRRLSELILRRNSSITGCPRSTVCVRAHVNDHPC